MRAAGQGRRMAGAFEADMEHEDDEEYLEARRMERYRMLRDEGRADDGQDLNGDDDMLDASYRLRRCQRLSPAVAWLQKPGTVKHIYRIFTNFLKDHQEEKIHEMCQSNS